MGNRGAGLALGVVLAIVIGAAAAFAYKQLRGNPTASQQPAAATPRGTAATPGEASPPAGATASPASGASPLPTMTPPAASPPPTAGHAALPDQLKAGSSYAYSGTGILLAGADDSDDSGSSACAGINDSTQAFAAGYEGVYFVAIQFTDGNRLSAGFLRNASGRMDFATVQNNRSGLKQGTAIAGPTSGSHTYCVTRQQSGWVMTDDGSAIYSTAAEDATTSSGASVLFESSAQKFDAAQPVAAFDLVVPGFLDLAVGGKAPTQLRGFTRAF